jgi:pyruvate/2-oxoglutarate dehydrogenase complex dihydrolipoamide acyltransferase (E2) component
MEKVFFAGPLPTLPDDHVEHTATPLPKLDLPSSSPKSPPQAQQVDLSHGDIYNTITSKGRNEKVLASPAVRSLAKKESIDISAIPGGSP